MIAERTFCAAASPAGHHLCHQPPGLQPQAHLGPKSVNGILSLVILAKLYEDGDESFLLVGFVPSTVPSLPASEAIGAAVSHQEGGPGVEYLFSVFPVESNGILLLHNFQDKALNRVAKMLP